MPMTKGSDGSETYKMGSGFKNALDAARGEDSDAKQPITNVHLEVADDGGVKSSVRRKQAGGDSPMGMDGEETATHDSLADAGSYVSQLDESNDSIA